MGKRKMSLQDALEIVPDDLPDGAYWAMAHEIAGAEYGDAWDELDGHPQHKSMPSPLKMNCPTCKRRIKIAGLKDHMRDAHKESKP